MGDEKSPESSSLQMPIQTTFSQEVVALILYCAARRYSSAAVSPVPYMQTLHFQFSRYGAYSISTGVTLIETLLVSSSCAVDAAPRALLAAYAILFPLDVRGGSSLLSSESSGSLITRLIFERDRPTVGRKWSSPESSWSLASSLSELDGPAVG